MVDLSGLWESGSSWSVDMVAVLLRPPPSQGEGSQQLRGRRHRDPFILSQVSGCRGHGGAEQTTGCRHTLTLGFTATQKGLSNALCQGWE